MARVDGPNPILNLGRCRCGWLDGWVDEFGDMAGRGWERYTLVARLARGWMVHYPQNVNVI